jgi:hypothetical protein
MTNDQMTKMTTRHPSKRISAHSIEEILIREGTRVGSGEGTNAALSLVRLAILS